MDQWISDLWVTSQLSSFQVQPYLSIYSSKFSTSPSISLDFSLSLSLSLSLIFSLAFSDFSYLGWVRSWRRWAGRMRWTGSTRRRSLLASHEVRLVVSHMVSHVVSHMVGHVVSHMVSHVTYCDNLLCCQYFLFLQSVPESWTDQLL